jgi:predicted glutamine amidotransferase
MCRWLAYTGTPLLLEELLYKPKHSLIDQSLHSRLGVDTTNGDGFGIGWYANGEVPALYKVVEPAWNDRNLRELSRQIRSGLLFAHVRASTGTAVQNTNSHPFRYGKWLWMHNGLIARFHDVKRELILAIDPSLYPHIEGTTDTETFFFLALTFGLEHSPSEGVERAVGYIESVCRNRGIDEPIRMTVATSNGENVWVFRYSSAGHSPSLFYSTKTDTLRVQYPDNPVMQKLSDESRLVVSEPISDLPGVWNEMPEASCGLIQRGQDELKPFKPRAA